jgi:hypothetical protein
MAEPDKMLRKINVDFANAGVGIRRRLSSQKSSSEAILKLDCGPEWRVAARSFTQV